MKNRLGRRKRLAAVAVVGITSVVGGAAWAYLDDPGSGSSSASIAGQLPRVTSGSTQKLVADVIQQDATVTVTNPLDYDIELTSIPVGTSKGYVVDANDPNSFYCPAASVKVGDVATDVNGAHTVGEWLPTGSNAVLTQEGGGTVIGKNGGTGTYEIEALFDVAAFPIGNEANRQNGCLGQTLQVDFGGVKFRQSEAP